MNDQRRRPMASAVVARQQGDDFQSRVFWMEACRLFHRRSKVARVAYEFNRIKAFDDVVVTYTTPLPDERGGVYTADYYQAKYHVDHAGSLTSDALIDPAAIGATTFSLLQRLHAAVQATTGQPSRFNLVSAWGVHPDDGLAELVSKTNGELRLERLFDGTTDRSARGKIRKAWREHLGLKTDDELQAVVAPLRFHAPYRSLVALRQDLNFRLIAAGLVPVDDGAHGHPYDDLVRKLHATGVNDFDRDVLRAACESEGLWAGPAQELSDRTPIGIRSFLRFAEHLEDETEHLLCMLKHFDGRKIRDADGWRTTLAAEVRQFLEVWTNRHGRFLLYLDAHSSLALLAGA
ncbi:MAG: SAVED domain-containing protein, partial [Planctomycetia bacterium]